MYGAVWVVTLACFLALRVAQADNFPVNIFIAVMTVGMVFSALISRRPLSESARIAFGFLDGMFALFALTAQTYLNELVGLSTESAMEVYLSRSFLWYLTLRSWVLVTLGSVAFQCVPGLAIFGLVATYVLSPELVWLFVLFVLAMLFTMAVAHQVESSPTPTSRALEIQSAFRVALGAGGVASLFGFAVAGLLALTLGQLISGVVVGLPLRNLAGTPTANDTPEIQVGAGPTSLSQLEVLRLTATGSARPRYLRQDAYDTYTGKGWNRTLTFIENAFPNADGVFTFPRFLGNVPETYQSTIRIRLQTGWHRAIYTPGVPLRVVAPTRQIALHIPYRTMTVPGALGAGATYEVTAYIPPDDPNLLRQYRAFHPRYSAYLSTASSERVKKLVQEIVRGAPTDYDKVLRLKQFIERTAVYNLQTTAYPPDEDPVDYFLFEAQEGYCVEFATALAVMCQLAGMPARVVSGYLLREPDPETGEYIVRESDRHLWTEVYFDGVGWVAFDATEGARVVEQSDEVAGTTSEEAHRRTDWQRRLIDTAIGLGVLYLLFLIASSWRTHRMPFAVRRKQGELYRQLIFALQVAGISAPTPNETPCAFLQRAQRMFRSTKLEEALQRLQGTIPTYLYAHAGEAEQLEPSIREQMREFQRAFKQEIPLAQRILKAVQIYWQRLNGYSA